LCNAWCLEFAKNSLQFWPSEPIVLEVGSFDVNGAARPVCEASSKNYLGVDIEKSLGAEAIIDANRLIEYLRAEAFDAVISTEMVEHLVDWPNVFNQMLSVVKPKGLLVLTIRSIGHF
jgi:SAM-dependent methyltransferase